MSSSPLPECRFAVGESFASRLVFTEDSIRQFATLCGDHNPLHHDAAYARATRFGTLIAAAADYSAKMIGAVSAFLTLRGVALGLEFTFQYHRAVQAGETLDLGWRILSIEPKPSLRGHIVLLAGSLARPDGSPSVSATSKAVVMEADALLREGPGDDGRGSGGARF